MRVNRTTATRIAAAVLPAIQRAVAALLIVAISITTSVATGHWNLIATR